MWETMSPLPSRKWKTRSSLAAVPSDLALVGHGTKYMWKQGGGEPGAGWLGGLVMVLILGVMGLPGFR